ncbi:MAG: hypothetical protein RJA99_775 [Pseudomonadota bacterium]|jgi:hypothetical protein
MGVAFELEVTRSRGADRFDALAWFVAAASLSLCATSLAAGPVFVADGEPGLRAALAIVAALSAVVSIGLGLGCLLGRRAASARPPARLSVSDDGALALQDHRGPARPMALRASCALPGLTLLVVAPYPGQWGTPRRGRPVALRIGRDAVPADGWRRLHVWLRWIERGPPGP